MRWANHPDVVVYMPRLISELLKLGLYLSNGLEAKVRPVGFPFRSAVAVQAFAPKPEMFADWQGTQFGLT